MPTEMAASAPGGAPEGDGQAMTTLRMLLLSNRREEVSVYCRCIA